MEDLSYVEFDFVLFKGFSFLQMKRQVAANHEWHDEVEALRRREEVVHVDQVIVLHGQKHLKLSVH